MPDRSLEVLLLCPTGQDSHLIASFLAKEKIESHIVHSLDELCDVNYDNAGVILIAEEALTPEGIEKLNSKLSVQEPWSDIPIILLTSGGPKNSQFKVKRLEVFVESGNVTLLERPLQQMTLLSATKVAMRARRRQYFVRNLMIDQVAATKMRDEFISIASHELKTPLTSLKLQTQMARRLSDRPESLSKEKMQKQLSYTINQIDRLNKLVDDMLDISRINTGKLNINRKEFNLSELLLELIERFTPQFEAVGCSLEFHVEENITGNWDAYKIEQVINNLFSNAIRYSPETKISVNLIKRDGKAVLNIQDYGIGIEAHNLDRIFERFERADSSPSTRSGLGLGLYITRQILNLHNADIKVESEVGKGSNFIIELPL